MVYGDRSRKFSSKNSRPIFLTGPIVLELIPLRIYII